MTQFIHSVNIKRNVFFQLFMPKLVPTHETHTLVPKTSIEMMSIEHWRLLIKD